MGVGAANVVQELFNPGAQQQQLLQQQVVLLQQQQSASPLASEPAWARRGQLPWPWQHLVGVACGCGDPGRGLFLCIFVFAAENTCTCCQHDAIHQLCRPPSSLKNYFGVGFTGERGAAMNLQVVGVPPARCERARSPTPPATAHAARCHASSALAQQTSRARCRAGPTTARVLRGGGAQKM